MFGTYYGPFCTIPGIATRQTVAMSADTKNWPVPNCPIILRTASANAPSDGVWVDAIPGRAEPAPTGLTTDCLEIHGLKVCPYSDPAFGILYLRVSGPPLPHALMFELSYNPLNPLIVCPPTIRLSPGLNRFPISISSDFQACTQTSSQATEQLPACTSHGMPSLAPGRYETKIVTSGLPAGTQLPPAIEVTLLAAR